MSEDDPSTYARPANRNPLGEDADQMCDLMRDCLATFTNRHALEAWLIHPRTVRFMERLRFTPGAHVLWAEMNERIAAAREWATPPDQEGSPP